MSEPFNVSGSESSASWNTNTPDLEVDLFFIDLEVDAFIFFIDLEVDAFMFFIDLEVDVFVFCLFYNESLVLIWRLMHIFFIDLD